MNTCFWFDPNAPEPLADYICPKHEVPIHDCPINVVDGQYREMLQEDA